MPNPTETIREPSTSGTMMATPSPSTFPVFTQLSARKYPSESMVTRPPKSSPNSKGSKNHDWEVAGSLQYQKTTYELGVSTASTGNDTDSKHNYDLWKLNPKSGINSGVWSMLTIHNTQINDKPRNIGFSSVLARWVTPFPRKYYLTGHFIFQPC